MAMVNVTGPALAENLAATLTDTEFELLMRHRMKRMFDMLKEANPNAGDSHIRVSFRMSATEKAEWNVHCGENYNLYDDATGEVLTFTARDVLNKIEMRKGNKISLLLGSPPDTKQATDGEANAAQPIPL